VEDDWQFGISAPDEQCGTGIVIAGDAVDVAFDAEHEAALVLG
jgi:hypothetical protein